MIKSVIKNKLAGATSEFQAMECAKAHGFT